MTLPVLLQKENTGGLGSSSLNLLDPKYDRNFIFHYHSARSFIE